MDIMEFYYNNFDVVGAVNEGLEEYKQLKQKKELEKEIKNNVDVYKFLMALNMAIMEGYKVKVKIEIDDNNDL